MMEYEKHYESTKAAATIVKESFRPTRNHVVPPDVVSVLPAVVDVVLSLVSGNMPRVFS